MSESLQEIFIQEADDNIAFLESAVFEMEESPNNEKVVNDIFRAMHSIKGGAGLAGFTALKDFTHHLEDLMEQVRNKTKSVDSEIISLIFEGIDVIKAMIENIKNREDSTLGIDTEQYVVKIVALLRGESSTVAQVTTVSKNSDSEQQLYYYLDLEYYDSIFSSGIDTLMFIKDLEYHGKILKLHTNTDGIPDILSFDPVKNYLTWQLFYQTKLNRQDLEDIFCFVIDESQIKFVELNPILDNPSELEKYLVDGKSLVDIAPEIFAVKPEEKESNLEVRLRKEDLNQSSSSSDPKLQITDDDSFMRVKTSKLENIFNTIGELLINQSRLHMLVEDGEDILDDEFLNVSDALKNITDLLQEQVTGLRMINLEGTFNKYKRVVRDLAISNNKEIKLTIEGKSTELDKNMIEKLDDPIKHIIRNCVDHGIESSEERIKLGKNPEGQMLLSAHLEGGKVVITISDNGRGINRERLLAKAKEKNIVSDDARLSDSEILNLIFHPGLSTAESVTDISGRGVGMDVVKSTINELHGNVTVESEPGIGTTFRLYLPLTLAILDGMLVRIGREKYIIPTLSILEIFRPEAGSVKTISSKGEVVLFRNEYIPIVRLYKLFKLENTETDPEDAELIVIMDGNKKVALLVDFVQDQFQVVLKSLQKNYRRVKFISSATILGNGDVALILDLQSIVHYTIKEKKCINNTVPSINQI
ncbi:MAG: chemotaxis protein CheA [Spirochaetales bacterium]|nr:chemotaxis protein CheA [Spirochaetales bacterium]